MTYSLTWMPGALRDAGLRVEEVGGWQNRGHGGMRDVRGVLLHHTAGPASGNLPSLHTLIHGRPKLPGPVCNLGLARDGTWYAVAAGRAWHAGNGVWPGIGRDNGNDHLIGVEAESTGRGDWTPAQLESYPRGVAALLRHLGRGPGWAIAHKEWAPHRKPDPAGWPGDMDSFRDRVADYLEGDDLPSAADVWNHPIAHPRKPEMVLPAWQWLAYGNEASWLAADGAWWERPEPSHANPDIPVRRFDFLRFVDSRTVHMEQQLAEMAQRQQEMAATLAALARRTAALPDIPTGTVSLSIDTSN
ncbi:N-acetylmuramoyl-L-alanine amidase [Allokutzneria sp. A3M-2-11 16]|uniref:N-acetylmuramoyl-L-alanine amidase n=1 Tax=Allokutzneria sp. A3M-2-11 16 TaxID=2962043 RepID=UPI0020B7CDBD|nr:N-acetylmuramoyl-L-alanine amidase [Allokutzneria sp. A3M-2-11 16]MCP3800311.1 N-acetylmuramoyl-L-alanine amidase [Allokutzneria sp. A3M-2-11 16]